MPIEVEIKAWVKKPAEVRAKLDGLCAFRREYSKKDVYFRGPSIEEKSQDVRIRSEGEGWVCTFKNKTLRGGLEVNEENEFEVSDGDALAKLLRLLGSSLLVRKNKRGRSYVFENLTVELSEVEGLGFFIEIERLLDGSSLAEVDDNALREAEAAVRGFLERVGVPASAIEEKPYTAMLLELANKRT